MEADNLPTAHSLAQKLLEAARINEPTVTNLLRQTAQDIAGKLYGLEHRFKKLESLARKLADRARDKAENEFAERLDEKALQTRRLLNEAEKVNDVLRYTIVLDADDFDFNFHRALTIVAGNGCEIKNI